MRNKQRGTRTVRGVSNQRKVTNTLTSESCISACNFDITNIARFISQIVILTRYSQDVLSLKCPQCFHSAVASCEKNKNKTVILLNLSK